VLFSVLADGETYAVCAIFDPYASHATNAMGLLGVVENMKTGSNL